MTAKQFVLDNVSQFSEHASIDDFVTIMRVPEEMLEVKASEDCITICGVESHKGEEDFQTAQYVRNLNYYFGELNMKLTLRAAFMLLTFVKYPLGCRALAHITSYLTEDPVITLDVLIRVYNNDFPSFDFMSKWWEIYKEENKMV